ncbi:MAG: monofunctional biosynthetic peptidoglycan transglycosylase, partial [Ignavibacteria bacterium]
LYVQIVSRGVPMIREFLRWALRTVVAFLVFSVLVVAMFRIVPPAITPLMVWRIVQAPFTGKTLFVKHHWVSMSKITPQMGRAMIAGEDAGFVRHKGIDWRAVDRAKRANVARVRKGKPPLGASTITMQTCKNVFLLPVRSMLRKGAEVYFVYLTEALWGKHRILEVYLNMIEWGDGIYGVHQGARHWFGADPGALTPDQAALMGAIVPNPRKFSASQPSPYIRRKAGWIRGRMRGVSSPK